MSTRNGTEFYSGFFPFFQERKLQFGLIGFGHLAGQFVGTARYVIQKINHLTGLFMFRIAGDVKGIAGFQWLEYAPHLV